MKRLVDELGPSSRRDVLTSAAADAPRSPEGRARALAAAMNALGAPGTAGDASAKGGSGTRAPQGSGSMISTPVVKGIVAAAVFLGGVALVAGLARRGDVPPSPRPSVVAPSGVASAETPPPVSEASPVGVTPVASASDITVSSGHASSDAAPSKPSREEDLLAREVRSIAAARKAMAAGEADRALRELDGYDRIPRAQTLRPEARMLRLEALARAGRVDEARRLGAALKGDSEMSSYLRRIDAVLASLNAGDQ